MEPRTLAAAVLVALAMAAFLALRRANEIAAFSIRDGAVLLYRGYVPQALVNDIATVARRERIARATVRLVKVDGRPTLVTVGVGATAAQALRNIVPLHAHRLSLAALRAAPPGPRTLGQRLGIASLAWWQEERRKRTG